MPFLIATPTSLSFEDLGGAIEAYLITGYDATNNPAKRKHATVVTVYAKRTEQVVPDGLSFEVTVGNLEGDPLGYEVADFIPANPPLFGSITPTPPLVESSTILALWSFNTGDFEIWFEGLLPTEYTSVRIETNHGDVTLAIADATDYINDPAQSWLWWATGNAWNGDDLGEIRTVTFLA